jgi:hypothetical protein
MIILLFHFFPQFPSSSTLELLIVHFLLQIHLFNRLIVEQWQCLDGMPNHLFGKINSPFWIFLSSVVKTNGPLGECRYLFFVFVSNRSKSGLAENLDQNKKSENRITAVTHSLFQVVCFQNWNQGIQWAIIFISHILQSSPCANILASGYCHHFSLSTSLVSKLCKATILQPCTTLNMPEAVS